jgi:[acyl-carrier-protein] S-malonyltransferase
LEIAILIGPARCLLGGPVASLDAASAELAAQGADVSRLRIGVASHTSQMQPAAASFADAVEPLEWHAPQTLLVCNRTGNVVRRMPDLKRCLAEQIDHTVQWQRSMETLAERRPACVLEVGAGAALSRLWLESAPHIPARSVDEFGSAASAVAWVRGCLA